MTFTVATLGTDDNVLLIFKARIGPYAPLERGSVIKSGITVTAKELRLPSSANTESRVADFADVVMFKAETKDGGNSFTVVYTLYNYGNTEAADASLSDTYRSAPYITSVETGGVKLPASDYTYVGGEIKLPARGAKLTVPAAGFSRSPSGEVITFPGSRTVTVKGIL